MPFYGRSDFEHPINGAGPAALRLVDWLWFVRDHEDTRSAPAWFDESAREARPEETEHREGSRAFRVIGLK